MNPQHRNVGNPGDVLKHAALVELARTLRLDRGGSGPRFRYVDTHTFLLEAPCVDPSAWLARVDRERERFAAYTPYFELERGVTRGEPYRCSARLAVDVLDPAETDLVLAESEPATRGRLRSQLLEARLAPEELLEDAAHLPSVRASQPGERVLALVDPFVLTDALWTALSPGLARLFPSGSIGILEAFTFDAHRAAATWPCAPGALVGPLASIDRGPYHLALYATAAIADEAARACNALGWR